MFIAAVVASAAVIMFIIECLTPGRKLPKVSGWWGRVILLNAFQVGLVFAAAKLWDQYLATHRLWQAESLGNVGGALLGYVVVTFIYYWWHRWRHESNFLWRVFHQLHHSPQRLEVVTSFYKHPAEIAVNGLLSSLICYSLCGLTVEQTTLTILLTGLAELIYHWNVKTPQWLGWFFQRPEMHCLHHEAGVHGRNYGDLPIWDMLFGTYYNPPSFDGECGFGEKEKSLGAMLLTRDISSEACESVATA